MSKKFPIFLTFKAVDDATASMKKINNRFKKQSQAVSILTNKYSRLKTEMSGITRVGKKIGGSMASVGKGMSTGLTLPLAAFGASTIMTAAKFEKSMNKVKALTGATGSSFNSLNDKAKELGSSTEYSASQVGDAMGFLGMAGFKTSEILGTIGPLLDLATASGTDLARSADIASNIMGAFAIDSSDTEAVKGVMDTLAAATASANVDMEMLAETMAKTAPIAKKYGLSLEDTTAATGLLGNIGIQGSVAGTALNNMMLRLAAPTAGVKKALKEVGLQTTDSNGKMRSMTDILKDLGSGMKKMPQGKQLAVLNEIFGKRAIAGAGELLTQSLKVGDDGMNAIERYTKSLEGASEGAGKAAQMAGIMRNGASGAMDSLKSAFEGLQIAIADSGLLEAFTGIVKKLTEMVSWLSRLNPGVLQALTVFGTLLAVLGPILWALGSFVSAVSTLLPLITMLKAGVLIMAKAALIPALIVIGKVALVIGAAVAAFYAIGKAIEWVAELFGIKIKPIEAVIDAFSRLWEMTKKFGKGILAKFGINLSSDDNLNNIAPSSKNLLTGQTKDFVTANKMEKTEKFELTLKDEKGNTKDFLKIGESNKLVSSNLGPVMGGI